MKQPRLLVIGSLVMDLIVCAERFVNAGETILGTDYHTASGGKGANQAAQAALLGADVAMAGKVGDDAFGREMLSSLNRAGVDTSRVRVTHEAPSGVGNIQIQSVMGKTQTRLVVVPGANMTFTQDDIAPLEREICRYDMVILQLEIPMAVNELVAAWAARDGVPVMLNPAPAAALDAAFLSHLSWLAPNEHEASLLTGLPIATETDMRRAADWLRQRGCPNVIITLGDRGAACQNGETFFVSPCIPCKHPVDPTAAGDSFIGAFCTALSAGMPVRQAMTFANQAASITVSRMGAQPSLPNLQMVNERLLAAGQATLRFDA